MEGVLGPTLGKQDEGGSGLSPSSKEGKSGPGSSPGSHGLLLQSLCRMEPTGHICLHSLLPHLPIQSWSPAANSPSVLQFGILPSLFPQARIWHNGFSSPNPLSFLFFTGLLGSSVLNIPVTTQLSQVTLPTFPSVSDTRPSPLPAVP